MLLVVFLFNIYERLFYFITFYVFNVLLFSFERFCIHAENNGSLQPGL